MICPFLSCCVGFSSPDKHQNQYIEKSQQCYLCTCMMLIVYHDCAAIHPAMSDPTACMLLICQFVTIRSDLQWSDHWSRCWSSLITTDLPWSNFLWYCTYRKQPSKFDAWQTKKTIHDSLIVCFVLFVRSPKNRLKIDSLFSPLFFLHFLSFINVIQPYWCNAALLFSHSRIAFSPSRFLFSHSRIFLHNATVRISCMLSHMLSRMSHMLSHMSRMIYRHMTIRLPL